MTTTEKRTVVKAPKYGYFPTLRGRQHDTRTPADIIEVGPRLVLYRHEGEDTPAEKGALARRKVYLNGECIGYVHQHKRRATRPTHRGSRIVTVTGYPVEWVPGGGSLRDSYPQMNSAVYTLVERHLTKAEEK